MSLYYTFLHLHVHTMPHEGWCGFNEPLHQYCVHDCTLYVTKLQCTLYKYIYTYTCTWYTPVLTFLCINAVCCWLVVCDWCMRWEVWTTICSLSHLWHLLHYSPTHVSIQIYTCISKSTHAYHTVYVYYIHVHVCTCVHFICVCIQCTYTLRTYTYEDCYGLKKHKINYLPHSSANRSVRFQSVVQFVSLPLATRMYMYPIHYLVDLITGVHKISTYAGQRK